MNWVVLLPLPVGKEFPGVGTSISSLHTLVFDRPAGAGTGVGQGQGAPHQSHHGRTPEVDVGVDQGSGAHCSGTTLVEHLETEQGWVRGFLGPTASVPPWWNSER